MSGRLGAVIIAAHNEQAVIAHCLTPLHEGVRSGDLRVIVVCNGCSDDTAGAARSFEGVEVLELPEASKPAALRAGDAATGDGPRIYLDADVTMSSRAAAAVLRQLGDEHALAARPPVRFDTRRAGVPVRLWYAVRVQLPSIRDALWGAGTYALSARGRARFEEFPDIVSDDLFIDSLFDESETVIVSTDPVIVTTPRTTSDLLKILIRTYRTQAEVDRGMGGAAISRSQRGQLRDLGSMLRTRPLLLPAAAVYVTLIGYARLRARAVPASVRWERDNSSRQR